MPGRHQPTWACCYAEGLLRHQDGRLFQPAMPCCNNLGPVGERYARNHGVYLPESSGRCLQQQAACPPAATARAGGAAVKDAGRGRPGSHAAMRKCVSGELGGPHRLVVAVARASQAQLPCSAGASARLEGVNRPELLPKDFTTVIDVAGFLSDGQVRRCRPPHRHTAPPSTAATTRT